MDSKIRKLFKEIKISPEGDFLQVSVLKKIERRIKTRHQVRLYLNMALFLLSFSVMFYSVKLFTRELLSYGFLDYASLVFYDLNIALVYSKELVLSLVSSVSFISFVLLLVIIFFTITSLLNFINTIKFKTRIV